ncbi:phosphotransferase family protein [Sediminibacterium sp. TEGAF015]|uniref:phosphotransferase family protein n=1 Tax=Sediminibacterium sp. TEGAF015 TaxID=575378 RepID=UPI002231B8B3|nr:phosphotransferase family protein [Sediminibacterium sp. TEGAF015]
MMEKTVPLSEKENFDIERLNQLLVKAIPEITPIKSISRFPGGYSNLTYQIQTGNQNLVMRMAPPGAAIQSAHDMEREYKVLKQIEPFFSLIPHPVLYCIDDTITGKPFYIMHALEGIILRAQNTPRLSLSQAQFTHCSTLLVETLAALHSIDIHKTNLVVMGKPEGYVSRQVSGWIKRYYAAETNKISSVDTVAQWLEQNLPREQVPAFLHNDFKYDNVVFNESLTSVVGVLDWEMATVGDPLMDLGAMLAYWFEADEEPIFKHYNCTWLTGNLTRSEIIAMYASLTKRDVSDMHFYYAFGLFKNAVIAQQIYHRYQHGHSTDERFGALLPLIELLGTKALKAIRKY